MIQGEPDKFCACGKQLAWGWSITKHTECDVCIFTRQVVEAVHRHQMTTVQVLSQMDIENPLLVLTLANAQLAQETV